MSNYKADLDKILDSSPAFTDWESRKDDPQERREAAGIVVSVWSEWNGEAIMDVMIAAFEDSNFHTLCEWLEDNRDALLNYDSEVGIVIPPTRIAEKMATEASHMTLTVPADKPVESYPITSLSRADIDGLGYDSSKLDNIVFEQMASKLGDHFVAYGNYWEDLREMCQDAELPYDPTKDNQSDDYEDDDA